MSRSGLLYSRGLNSSDPDCIEEEWNDNNLQKAYERAVKLANTDVAKSIAMSTNTQSELNVNKSAISKHKSGKQTQKGGSKIEWKLGMNCRAVYQEDGLEYEAFVLKIIDDINCVVKFIGYANSEIVELSSLKPSLGQAERAKQIQDSLRAKVESDGSNLESSDGSPNVRTPSLSSADANHKKKKSKKKKSKQLHGFNPANMQMPMPDVPIPDFAKLKTEVGAADFPIPPPPTALNLSNSSEDEAVSSMLISWYMSGYYTGLYQGMKRAK